MAITAAERNQIVELTVLMFNAAPGEVYLAQIVALYEANPGTQAQKLQALANQLAQTSVYRSMHPNFETAEEFAASFLTPLGLQNDATARDFVIAKYNAGVPKGQIMYEGYVALNAVPSTGAAQYVAANAILNNRTTVAEFYSVNGGVATDLASLQSVINTVTADPATVTAAQNAILQGGSFGQTFTLTTNQDTLTGTGGADAFNAGVAVLQNGGITDTLQSFDQINGAGGVDTLNATVNSGAVVTPSLTDVENVVLRSTTAGSGIDLSASTGVQRVIVSNSTATAVVNGVGAAGTLGVANQNQNVAFDGSTATSLALSFDTVGVVSATAAVEVAVDIGAAAASKATTLNITTVNSNVEVKDTAGANVATAATIAASGANELKLTDGLALASLTVTGTGSVDVSEVQLVKVSTLTVGDGGIKFDSGDSTATSFTATTGAGKDTLTVDGAVVKSISTGAGNDSVTTATAALAATATIDLGAGDDTLTLHAAPAAAGATLSGGEGTKDTLALAVADYGTVSGYTAANLAKITGFEILSATDAAVANGASIDLSKIAGLTGFQSKGVAAGGAATVTNVGANADIILKGDLATNTGALTVTLKDATGASDTLNLTINTQIAQNADATVNTTAATATVTASGVEVLHVTSTGFPSIPVPAGAKADVASNTLALTDTALTTLHVMGDQAFTFNTADAMTKLATINASGLTAGATISAAATTTATNAALTITGSATAGNTLTGSANNDTIVGGAKADTITGGAGADTLTGGAGNDIFAYTAAVQSTLTKLDVITDFSANTFGNGTNGAAGTGAGADSTKWTGDVIRLDVDLWVDANANGVVDAGEGTFSKVAVSVQTNAADATVFLQNTGDATADTIAAALDSTSGRLYIDWNSDGTADSVIQLTGVTTITAAAFVLV